MIYKLMLILFFFAGAQCDKSFFQVGNQRSHLTSKRSAQYEVIDPMLDPLSISYIQPSYSWQFPSENGIDRSPVGSPIQSAQALEAITPMLPEGFSPGVSTPTQIPNKKGFFRDFSQYPSKLGFSPGGTPQIPSQYSSTQGSGDSIPQVTSQYLSGKGTPSSSISQMPLQYPRIQDTTLGSTFPSPPQIPSRQGSSPDGMRPQYPRRLGFSPGTSQIPSQYPRGQGSDGGMLQMPPQNPSGQGSPPGIFTDSPGPPQIQSKRDWVPDDMPPVSRGKRLSSDSMPPFFAGSDPFSGGPFSGGQKNSLSGLPPFMAKELSNSFDANSEPTPINPYIIPKPRGPWNALKNVANGVVKTATFGLIDFS